MLHTVRKLRSPAFQWSGGHDRVFVSMVAAPLCAVTLRHLIARSCKIKAHFGKPERNRNVPMSCNEKSWDFNSEMQWESNNLTCKAVSPSHVVDSQWLIGSKLRFPSLDVSSDFRYCLRVFKLFVVYGSLYIWDRNQYRWNVFLLAFWEDLKWPLSVMFASLGFGEGVGISS